MSNIWHDINPRRISPEKFMAVIEIPKGVKNKYEMDKETGLLKPEARLVNVKDLIKSPYSVLIELLVSGPKNDKLKVVIPENTKLLNASLDKECLTLDFSSEILNYSKDDSMLKNNLIYSIVNTVTELNEVNKVKFLVNGQTSSDFEEFYVRK